MKPTFLLPLALLLLALAGCGGGTETVTKTVASAADNPAPVDSPAPTDTSCDGKGINTTVGKTGTCDQDGVTFTVVNHDQPLRLDDYTVRLKKTYKVASVAQSETDPPLKANGRFVIFRLAVKNTSNSPLDWGKGGPGRTALVIGDNWYAPDTSQAEFWQAIKVNGDNGEGYSKPIQPDSTGQGWVAFDTPNRAVRKLTARGSNLMVLPNSEFEGGAQSAADQTATTYGVIRLWK